MYWVSLPAVHAHPEVEDRIILVTEQIGEDPTNGRLYLRRGELYRERGSWQDAATDYSQAEKLAGDLPEIDRARAELALEIGEPARAVRLARRYLRKQPEHPRGLLILARGLGALDRTSASNETYRRFIVVAAHPKPDYYLEWASVLMADEDWAAADEVLQLGIREIAPVTALLQRSLEVQLEAGDHPAALATADQLIEISPRREHWWLEKAQIYESLGQNDEARFAYEQARDVLAARPQARKSLPALVEVGKEVAAGLARLPKKSDKAGG